MLTTEQRALRREGAGASDVPVIVGLDPFQTVMDVFREKTEEGYERGENEATERGHMLEPAVRSWYAARTGADVQLPGTLRHPDLSFALATPDGIAYRDGEQRVLECKTAAWADRSVWGESGTDLVPPNYLVQTQWQLLVTGLKSADLAALLWGTELRIYTIERDASLIAMLVEQVEWFWRNHIIPRVPPPLQGDDSTARYLASKYPMHTPELAAATAETLALRAEYDKAKVAHDAAVTALEYAKNRIKDAIGNSAGIEGVATWRQVKGRTTTDWEAVARACNAPPTVIDAYTARKPGHRTFRVHNGGNNGSDE